MEPCRKRLLDLSPAVLTEFIVLDRAMPGGLTPGGLDTTLALPGPPVAGVIVLWLLDRPLPAPRSERDFLVGLAALTGCANPTLSTDQVLFRLLVTAIMGPRLTVSSSSLESAAADLPPDRARRLVSVRVVQPDVLRFVRGGESAPPLREPRMDPVSPAGLVLKSLAIDLKNPPFFLPFPRSERTLDPSDAAPPEKVLRRLCRLKLLRFRGGL